MSIFTPAHRFANPRRPIETVSLRCRVAEGAGGWSQKGRDWWEEVGLVGRVLVQSHRDLVTWPFLGGGVLSTIQL